MDKYFASVFITGVLLAESTAQIEPGVSNPLYSCSDVSLSPRLSVDFPVTSVTCGTLVPLAEANVQPTISYPTVDDSSIEYYTLLCLNPDDIIPVGPIIHHGVGNIPAAELGQGKLGENSTTFVNFFGPSPPVGRIKFTYVYQLYAQADGLLEFPALDSFLFFPVEDFVERNNLLRLEQNYWLTDANV